MCTCLVPWVYLKEHFRNHHHVGCENCGKTLINMQRLYRHTRKCKVPLKVFCCDHCGEKFTKYELECHLKKIYPHFIPTLDSPNNHCLPCQLSISKLDWREHCNQHVHKLKAKNVFCDVCCVFVRNWSIKHAKNNHPN